MATRPIVDTLRDLRQGAVLEEASEELHRIVQAVRDTGKAGKLTITLTVKPFDKNADILNIEDKVVAVVPQAPKGGTVMFTTVEGNLSRRDPRQGELPMAVVPQEAMKVDVARLAEVARG
jgi:hypothetical protein